MKWNQMISLFLATACLWAGGYAAATENSFYEEPPLFSTAPSPEKSLQTITRFGPVGMGIDLIQPAFTMQIHNIEEGSPAVATGKLKAGQIIESINGQKLADTATTSTRSYGQNSKSTIPCCMICWKKSGAR
ncbi:MAG: PDZ domain-containing protein [Planctomycetes bacterium]|nr:PDZ domain-containing protein [Planctomycetota bacterium]MBL7039615.1 PDZ domain-containing protein [Pirellulaceae bacterium]